MPKRKVTQVEFAPRLGDFGRAPTAKLRVAAYARVSTEKEEQEHSLEAQTDYFENYIKENPRWEFVGLYVDDGISGLSYHNREGFTRMVADAVDGKIDLIITKSLSRFARNTVDALMTIRKLKAEGVGVFFQKEDIDTLDSKGEFMLTLMSSFAEEESRSISDNVTWGKRKQFADGFYTVPFAHFLGYDRGTEKGEFVINEAEARVVRFIYMLTFEYYAPSHIAQLLTDMHIPSPGSKDTWYCKTIISILKNEKYKGDARLQKKFTVDFRTKKRKINEGELPQYYVENSHPAIIDAKAWDMVQGELRRIAEEMEVVAGLIEKSIAANAITALEQDEYAKTYESLTERYTALQKRYTTLTRQREDKQFKADELSGFLFELGELDLLDTECKDSRFRAIVERITVHNDGRLIFTFTNGSEETVMM